MEIEFVPLRHRYKKMVSTEAVSVSTGDFCGGCRRVASFIATSMAFNGFVAFVIVSNSVFLGMQLEWTAIGAFGLIPQSWTVV